jgi:double-stranded uracil-DNA glycosylase
MISRSFPPIAGSDASRLILGSMPGTASLQAREYYAHPRNAFWTIVESLLDIKRAAPYSERCGALATAGFAVWDVLKACRRSGSLDSAIEPDSIVANNFRRFLQRNPGIERPRITLPSTSPANASFTLQEKIRAWRVICRHE